MPLLLPNISAEKLHHAYLFTHNDPKIRAEYSLQFISVFYGQKLLKSHPDFIVTDPSSIKYGINLIREINSRLSRKPYQLNKNIVLIHDAHELTTEAQNALLKTLEEPPSNSLVILNAKHQDNLLATITSRCEIFHIPESSDKFSQSQIKAETIQLLGQLNSQPLYERFKWAEANYQEKDILETLGDWLIYQRRLLLQEVMNPRHNHHRLYSLLKNLYEIDRTIRIFNSNTNFRLALEILMLKLTNVNL